MSVVFKVLPEKRKVYAILKSKSGETFLGLAKCNLNDSFDEEFGKQLASLRMRKRFLKRKKELVLEDTKIVQKMLDFCVARKDKLTVSLAKTEKELLEIEEKLVLLK